MIKHIIILLYRMIRENGGWDMFKMIQIKVFSCSNKREAEAEEDKIMMEVKATMNHQRSSRTSQQYYQDNREILCKKTKQWRMENLEKARDYSTKYHIEHGEAINEKNRNQEKMMCECGSEFHRAEKNRHLKTKKHQNFIFSGSVKTLFWNKYIFIIN